LPERRALERLQDHEVPEPQEKPKEEGRARHGETRARRVPREGGDDVSDDEKDDRIDDDRDCPASHSDCLHGGLLVRLAAPSYSQCAAAATGSVQEAEDPCKLAMRVSMRSGRPSG